MKKSDGMKNVDNIASTLFFSFRSLDLYFTSTSSHLFFFPFSLVCRSLSLSNSLSLYFTSPGALYGTYEAFRYKVPGVYKLRYVGQTTLSSAAVFGLFLGAGSLLHCGRN